MNIKPDPFSCMSKNPYDYLNNLKDPSKSVNEVSKREKRTKVVSSFGDPLSYLTLNEIKEQLDMYKKAFKEKAALHIKALLNKSNIIYSKDRNKLVKFQGHVITIPDESPSVELLEKAEKSYLLEFHNLETNEFKSMLVSNFNSVVDFFTEEELIELLKI